MCIRDRLKVLLAEKAQSAEMEVEAPVKEAVPEEKPEVPIYRESANYAYEAGELESYRADVYKRQQQEHPEMKKQNMNKHYQKQNIKKEYAAARNAG